MRVYGLTGPLLTDVVVEDRIGVHGPLFEEQPQYRVPVALDGGHRSVVDDLPSDVIGGGGGDASTDVTVDGQTTEQIADATQATVSAGGLEDAAVENAEAPAVSFVADAVASVRLQRRLFAAEAVGERVGALLLDEDTQDLAVIGANGDQGRTAALRAARSSPLPIQV